MNKEEFIQQIFIDGEMLCFTGLNIESFDVIFPQGDIMGYYISKEDFDEGIFEVTFITHLFLCEITITSNMKANPKKEPEIEVKLFKLSIEQIEIDYKVSPGTREIPRNYTFAEQVRIKFKGNSEIVTLPSPINNGKAKENYKQFICELNEFI